MPPVGSRSGVPQEGVAEMLLHPGPSLGVHGLVTLPMLMGWERACAATEQC